MQKRQLLPLLSDCLCLALHNSATHAQGSLKGFCSQIHPRSHFPLIDVVISSKFLVPVWDLQEADSEMKFSMQRFFFRKYSWDQYLWNEGKEADWAEEDVELRCSVNGSVGSSENEKILQKCQSWGEKPTLRKSHSLHRGNPKRAVADICIPKTWPAAGEIHSLFRKEDLASESKCPPHFLMSNTRRQASFFTSSSSVLTPGW